MSDCTSSARRNGYIESFISRVREECLNINLSSPWATPKPAGERLARSRELVEATDELVRADRQVAVARRGCELAHAASAAGAVTDRPVDHPGVGGDALDVRLEPQAAQHLTNRSRREDEDAGDA